MKRLLWVLTILLLVLASASYAQEAPKPGTETPAVTATQDEAKPTDDTTTSAPSDEAKPSDETKPSEQSEDVVTTEEEYRTESEKRRRIPFALTVGVYTPTDSGVKGVFGDSWTRWGIRPLPMSLPNRWRPNFDVSYYSMSDDQDEARLLPMTVGILRGFGKSKAKGYVSVNAGVCYFDVSAPTVATDKNGMGLTANVTLGALFNDRFSVEGRYEFMDEFAGFDFSSVSLSAAVKVFTAKF